ncbi:hypothetical protein [Chryseolinea sp. H1M3-3]|uniref:hypothetical protein n=1 Tax=Chryseolinea sp. H1M3-3 TaxID=3034144 RepID=UPI0023EBFBDD|nr:hypothetical protein [Chryseolinea sp. H1M3-3]
MSAVVGRAYALATRNTNNGDVFTFFVFSIPKNMHPAVVGLVRKTVRGGPTTARTLITDFLWHNNAEMKKAKWKNKQAVA